ncbi:MAG: hypothetical protein Q7S39_06460 [Ignavibacteria bacterium]|nr:hypothetical protein [Ignavibacteria bacterium]
MDNVSLILIMFLVAAINTLIVVTAVYLIFKIKVSKETETNMLMKEELAKAQKQEPSLIQKENNLQEDLSTKPKIENEKEKEVSKEKEKEEPKFLKYTSKGYIDPENDIKKRQHTWR